MRAGSRGIPLALVLCLGAIGAVPLRAQSADEPDPCADAVGGSEQNQCWVRQAEHADAEMKQALDALVAKLPSGAAGELKKAQKAWLDFREAHLAMLYTATNPKRVHSTDASICNTIARWQLARQRTREMRRLLTPAADEACPP